MSIPRIYHAAELSVNKQLSLDLTASHHLLQVLRLRIGDKIILFNGESGEYNGELIAVEKKLAVIKIQRHNDIDRESSLKIHLGQGIARGEKMDFIIQKAVELGVEKIAPLFTEFSNVKLPTEQFEKKLAHWQKIIISACEQCGRNQIPKIEVPQNLTIWIGQQKEKLKLILEPNAKLRLRDIKNPSQFICLLIGPEGGFSETETTMAQQHGFQPISLGPRILRTETAGLATVAAVQALWGDI